MDEKHILVSLGDEKVKEISEVIGNKSCNKILDFLASREGTVSDIAGKLKMPLNTVDYNIKKLVKAGLIEKASHWWSVKGRKMHSYRVSNRKIIISPKKSIAAKFLWVLGLTGLSALTIRQFMSRIVIDNAVPLFNDMKGSVATAAGDFIPEGGSIVVEPSFWTSISPASWFLIGAWFAVFLFFVLTIIKGKRW